MILHSGNAQEHAADARTTGLCVPDESDETRIQKQLANAIYEHRVRPGTKLPEADLCRIYGTTRGVIHVDARSG